MNEQQALTRKQVVWRSFADMAGWLVVLVLAASAQSVALTEGFGLDLRQMDYSDWRIYLTEYLMPLVSLPLLTWILWLRGERWSDVGFRRPESWPRFWLTALGATVATLLVNLGVRALPSLWGGTWPPSDFAAVAEHPLAFAILATYTFFLVGITEEALFRGFLLSRVARALGDSSRAWWCGIVIVALLFGLVHGRHGFVSILNATAIGLLYGVIYLRTGRNLWVLVAAHSLYDTARLVQLYFG
ncbi:MAG TPA: hypothetical protein DD490_17900 [Acidobacteria bacterium]|nr:hypothetical protein [Acidobacteriota bacterium]